MPPYTGPAIACAHRLHMADLESLALPALKKLAEDRGVKQVGVGWPTCCPPKGNKADVIRALGAVGGGAATPPRREAPSTTVRPSPPEDMPATPVTGRQTGGFDDLEDPYKFLKIAPLPNDT